ncbi:MAG: hypothetical protein H6710_00145 [Myxococcales bacterium]|nr:hypothetical protein [Myxococcales bacterium]
MSKIGPDDAVEAESSPVVDVPVVEVLPAAVEVPPLALPVVDEPTASLVDPRSDVDGVLVNELVPVGWQASSAMAQIPGRSSLTTARSPAAARGSKRAIAASGGP